MSSEKVEIVQDHVYILSNFGCIIAAKYEIHPKPKFSEPIVFATIFVSLGRDEVDYLVFEDDDPDGKILEAEHSSLMHFSEEQINILINTNFDDGLIDFWKKYTEDTPFEFTYFFSEGEFSSAYPNVERKRF